MKWVLVIEPSEVDREYLERIITRLGYQFFAARSGEEALHFMTQSLPDTIIVGERIPDYDPMEFARHIKEDHILSGPPILLMSSNTDDPYKSAALQAGFEQIVQRPMSIRSFFTKLEMCMSNNRRLCIRAPMEVPVRLTWERKIQSATTHNFGEGGMWQVAHTRDRDTDEVPTGMGLQFLDISPAIDAVLGIYMENFLVKRIPMAI
jgi:DNA-binding response OmpR family regulator